MVRLYAVREHTLLGTADLVTMPRNFWHWSVSDIDLRQIGACCACSKCGTFLFVPLMVIVLWPKYREKIAQHMLRAIAVLHFPICALKSCPAQQVRVTISPLPHNCRRLQSCGFFK